MQARAAWYGSIVRQVASWGYVVLQYTSLGVFPVVSDRIELEYLPPLLQWLSAQSAGNADSAADRLPANPLLGLADTSRLATMGHSRGGKLAALHYAGNILNISTAVLLDPIDNTDRAPEGPDYPSACKALAAANRTAAVVGAGISGRCNPLESNFRHFTSSLAPGSWQLVVRQVRCWEGLRECVFVSV
ncbi:hypothetical protein Agub_g2795 [Astrephomene gubernaculifera]|uniref:Chlorophyllase n=1 Tax=Astrephomene gubernaculifera TaxID=47775 RepID=A0AAD3DIU4_9CHLO|nr:hypothetical protein Agub_g2795 [Astrephomene gubernaculifera]